MKVLDPGRAALCLPQAMWLVHRTIMKSPELSRDEVLDLVTPVAMRSGSPMNGAHARQALAGLVEFRLVRDDGGLLLAAAVKSPQEFLRLLRRQVVVPPSQVDAKFEGAPDLRSALIWLMRQPPAEPLHYSVNVETSMPAGLFTNDTRWNGFRWWSEALGFAQEALKTLDRDGGAMTKIIPNPTVAVVDAIEHPFGDPLPRGEQIPVDQFLEFLRSELPVLPGHPSATYPGLIDDGTQAVAALGLALSTAEHRKILTMGYQSDPSSVLALPDAQNHRQARYVSYVTIGR